MEDVHPTWIGWTLLQVAERIAGLGAHLAVTDEALRTDPEVAALDLEAWELQRAVAQLDRLGFLTGRPGMARGTWFVTTLGQRVLAARRPPRR